MDTVSIDPLKLYSRLGSPVSPLVLDVRRDETFAEDSTMIAAAVRPGEDLVAFAKQHAAGRAIVAYCVHGHEVSQDAAQALPVYDGLYARCRSQCECDHEKHSWNVSA